MTYTDYYASPLGKILLASDGESLTGAWFEGQKYYAATICDEVVEYPDFPFFRAVNKWLDAYFSLKKPDIDDLPLAPDGGDFRQSVWRVLCEIPYGKVMTYGEIAGKVGCKSAQAIGGAVGHNPISVIIPCHRVVGVNGSLTGYAGGVDRKLKLLALENADISRLTVPTTGTAI